MLDHRGSDFSRAARFGPGGRLGSRLAISLILVLLAQFWAPAQASDLLPYSTTVEVRYGADEGGPASLREKIGAALVDRLRMRGCVTSVREPDDAPVKQDLVVRVTLDRVREQTRYETTLAEQARPTDPGTATRRIALFEVEYRVELLAWPGGPPVLEKRLKESYGRRPLTIDEDATERAREEGIENLARAAAARICGPRKKLRRKIEQARAGRESDSSSR